MRLIPKVLLGASALAVATAASFPHGIGDLYFGTYPQDIRKLEALKNCEEGSPTFVRFLASDRDECYRQMRGLGMQSSYSGVWSKPDRAHMMAPEN